MKSCPPDIWTKEKRLSTHVDKLAVPRERQQVLYTKGLEVFQRFDENKDGTIDLCELRTVLQELDRSWTNPRVEALFKAADFNGDGRIQFEEFLRWCFQGKGEYQPDFRETVGLQQFVKASVVVTVLSESGETVYGPEEFWGSFTVGYLKRRVAAATASPAASLLSASGDHILRDGMELGIYTQEENLTLRKVSDAFSLLSEDCLEELSILGAIGTFEGQKCIRIGRNNTRRQSCEGSVGRGEDHSEFLLLSDGRVMAKAYSYWGFAKTALESTRKWKYDIAEGTFSIMDQATCFIELYWRRWSERVASDKDGDGPPSADILKDWQEREVTELEQPHNVVPAGATNQLNVLAIAQSALEGYKRGEGLVSLDPKDDPLAGLPMPGIDRDELCSLSMEDSLFAEKYWQHGQKPTGPRSDSGGYVW